jgi:hypothetical protein
MAKLQNIKAIREMLDGKHRTQTRTKIGFSDTEVSAEKAKKREVGEIWEEYDEHGQLVCIWEQKQGYRIKSGVLKDAVEDIRTYLNSYPNCLEDCRTKDKNYTKLDKRFRAKFGRCADCQFRIETRLKQQGKFKEYEREQMLRNAEAFFKQADVEIETVYNQIAGESHFANSDGRIEVWNGNKDQAEKMRNEYYEYKKIAIQKIQEYNGNNSVEEQQ